VASPFGCRSGHISAFAEATLPRDGQVGEGVSPALDAQIEKHNDPRRSTYSCSNDHRPSKLWLERFSSKQAFHGVPPMPPGSLLHRARESRVQLALCWLSTHSN
jgi:hypothetical protein